MWPMSNSFKPGLLDDKNIHLFISPASKPVVTLHYVDESSVIWGIVFVCLTPEREKGSQPTICITY